MNYNQALDLAKGQNLEKGSPNHQFQTEIQILPI